MKFEKKVLTDLHRCYATSSTVIDGERHLLIATEGEGPCYMFSGEDFTRSTVWDGPGGTMSIVPIPGKNGDFLAVQNFFPTFQSEKATVVWGRYVEGEWKIKTIFHMPYLHRFDILEGGGTLYFLGAVLCNSKTDKEDWSNPGKLYVAKLPQDLNQPLDFQVIQEGLTKNHGYCRSTYQGHMVGMVTAEEGIFRVTPPQTPEGNWEVEQISTRPTSDIAVVDIDEDGVDELVTIEDFHGKNFRIYKEKNQSYEVVYEYPKEMDFGHVVWGGKLGGIPTVIGGYRRHDQDLFYVQCVDKEQLTFETKVIDTGVGPSNVAVLHEKDRDIIISANREVGQACLYFVTK